MKRKHVQLVLGFLSVAAVAVGGEAGARASGLEDGFAGTDDPYVRGLHQQINPIWLRTIAHLDRVGRLPRSGDSLTVEVVVAIDQDGQLWGVSRSESTGVVSFDETPVELLREVSRVTPPPPSMLNAAGLVYVRLVFPRARTGSDVREMLLVDPPVEVHASR